MSDALLRLRDVTAFYGPAQALFGVDLEVRAGQVVALMGRNGMGKTTTIRAICRLLPHRSGEIAFMGRDISRLPPHRAARLGLGLCPEGRRCFGNLTVEENLLATARPGPWTIERIAALFPRLAERRAQLARTLSGGEQQMLAVGRALATNPRLLILDEATEGLAPAVRREIWSALAALKAEGQAILIVDKTLREMLRLADACVILEKGVTVWSGPPSALTPELRDRHLGV
ncbi:ABC transporter ATP-binding protein [Oceanicella actignis]|uniref:Branched-chain amino acid transport system ATP-binding protein n=1 Tax=Oceanicella actignis TaxID=1189325 RepID=A0A1M7TAL1_9RHOB|nr:ABC transporter ATP-binding protein [Oceanicella actignis]SET52489.1 branched-chain amino acid transport system ATP-binding protein [Oceanicella actignis]SHN67754.1 branched-chain amino acid transport system ATP-binding protein [Oceanicella actignis]